MLIHIARNIYKKSAQRFIKDDVIVIQKSIKRDKVIYVDRKRNMKKH